MIVVARDLERMAHPTGGGRGSAVREIPVEGRDEWLTAAGIAGG